MKYSDQKGNKKPAILADSLESRDRTEEISLVK